MPDLLIPVLVAGVLFVAAFIYSWLEDMYWTWRVPDYHRELSDDEVHWLKAANASLIEVRDTRPGKQPALWALGLACVAVCVLGVVASLNLLPEVELALSEWSAANSSNDGIIARYRADDALALTGAGLSLMIAIWLFYAICHRNAGLRRALIHNDSVHYLCEEVEPEEGDLDDNIFGPVLDAKTDSLIQDVFRRSVAIDAPLDADRYHYMLTRRYNRYALLALAVAFGAGAFFLFANIGSRTSVHPDRVEIVPSIFATPEILPLSEIDEVRVSCAVCKCSPVARYRLRRDGEEIISIRIEPDNLTDLETLDRELRRAGVKRRKSENYDPECVAASREEMGSRVDALLSPDS